jgi:hypothetical protein
VRQATLGFIIAVLVLTSARVLFHFGSTFSLQWNPGVFLSACIIGLAEEYYFRGFWIAIAGPVIASGINAVIMGVMMAWTNSTQSWPTKMQFFVLPSLSLFFFGLAMSWAYQQSHSFAGIAGLHAGAYYAFAQRPIVPAGRSWRTMKYWLGGESPALGLAPVLLYGLVAGLFMMAVTRFGL